MPSVTPVLVVMGVSGSGKSTIAELVAKGARAQYIDADDLHPKANVDKMAAGVPLTDEDRWPWLKLVAQTMESSTEPLVVACSALRRSYRDVLRDIDTPVFFVHLHGDEGLLAQRLGGRANHFMPPDLLKSQLDTLEKLEEDELEKGDVVIDIALPRDQKVADIIELWTEKNSASRSEIK